MLYKLGICLISVLFLFMIIASVMILDFVLRMCNVVYNDDDRAYRGQPVRVQVLQLIHESVRNWACPANPLWIAARANTANNMASYRQIVAIYMCSCTKQERSLGFCIQKYFLLFDYKWELSTSRGLRSCDKRVIMI